MHNFLCTQSFHWHKDVPKNRVFLRLSYRLFLQVKVFKGYLAFFKDFIPGDEKYMGLAYNLNPILSKRVFSFT